MNITKVEDYIALDFGKLIILKNSLSAQVESLQAYVKELEERVQFLTDAQASEDKN